jgi:enoyl-CoA hydratase/carnithine racemase
MKGVIRLSDIKITNINGKDLKYLSLEIKENVGVITINNPPVNALSEQAYTEVGDIFEYVNSRDDIWVCIFRAEGKTYPVGLDVHGFLDNIANDRQLESAETFYRSTLAVYNCRVPVISAVQGFALGGGLCYAAGSDFIIAAEGAKFGFPEVKLGVVGGGAHLPRLVPPIVSRNMMFTGEFISAEDLYKFGGITQIVPREKLDEAAWEKATELKAKGPLVLRHLKVCMNAQDDYQMDRKNQEEIMHTWEMTKTEDLVEGVKAFLEKRTPVHKGR